MSASGHPDPSWNDFDQVRHSIKNYTVDRLKQIITGLSEGCGAMIAKSGKKQDLIDRITQTLDTYRAGQHTERWNRARTVIYQVQRTGTYHSGTANGLSSGISVPGVASSASSLTNGYHQSPGGAGPSGISRYDPMSVHRRAAPSSATSTPVRHGTAVGIKFKSSPFFSIDQAVSNVVECPESSGAMDRKQQTLVFALTQEHLNKLSQSNPKYQLRLFCTSSSFYVASPGGFRSNALPCPIEFPATCEVRVNNVQLSANLKGVKKKPGTAPPADLGRSVRSVAGAQNRVEMVYVNSQQPIVAKKYYLAVFLVEVTNVEQLVEKLRKGKYRSSDEIKSGMLKSAAEDDEIVAGNQTMSLKCPLSYTRIKTPCKSDKCVHSQCFDGTSWYSVMEQTTTWLCPVCEKVLNWEDLIVDGFFDAILRQTPESVEEVVVEPNGEWYTSDKKYASAGWKATHASKSPAQRTFEPSGNGSGMSQTPAESLNKGDFTKDNPTGNTSEVFILDSDDEDEGRVKRELSPTFGSSHINGNGKRASTSMSAADAVTKPKRQSTVIDLTLDSDSDEPPAPRKLEKRKADDSLLGQGDSSSKRPRGDMVPLTTRRSANGYSNGATSSASSPHPYYSSIPPPPLSPSVRSSNHSSGGNPSSTTHRTSAPAPLHASSRYGAGYNSYSPPHLPGRPGSYDPTRQNDPRSHQYPPPYSSNGYLPRVNGSGPSAWP